MFKHVAVLMLAGLMPLNAGGAGLADQVNNAGGGALLDQPVSALSGVQVVASKGASNVSIKVSRKTSISAPSNGPDPGVARFSVWSLTASSPLNKNSDDTDITTLDGLVNAAALEFNVGNYHVPGRRNNAPLRTVVPICARVSEAIKAQTGKPSDSAPDCDSGQVAAYGSADDKHDFESAFWDVANSNRWIWGVTAKLGYQEFEFVNAANVTRLKKNKTPWAAGAYVAYNPDAWHAVITLGVQYQDAYKDAKAGVVCPSSAVSGAPVVCESGPVGSPKETKKRLVSLSGRRAFALAGIGLTTTYDFESKVFAAELPVYFVKDKDGKFSAGVKAGWRDDTHSTVVSVFVGSTFGLFN